MGLGTNTRTVFAVAISVQAWVILTIIAHLRSQVERRLIKLRRGFTQSIGLSAHGPARLPDDGFGSILAANAAKYASFAGFTDS